MFKAENCYIFELFWIYISGVNHLYVWNICHGYLKDKRYIFGLCQVFWYFQNFMYYMYKDKYCKSFFMQQSIFYLFFLKPFREPVHTKSEGFFGQVQNEPCFYKKMGNSFWVTTFTKVVFKTSNPSKSADWHWFVDPFNGSFRIEL